MADFINYLPEEMHLEIFKYLNLHHLVVNCSETCIQWRDIIAQYILGPRIFKLASDNVKFKREIKRYGWSEKSNDTEFILFLYSKYELYSSK